MLQQLPHYNVIGVILLSSEHSATREAVVDIIKQKYYFLDAPQT
jgi:hypothetical protein